ncbi:MAG: hypothetical protein CME19_01180 [Gemmatimonadetes bacterium]|nr:hypothetical protein [Gemmatimonadota bacterium]|tara:strand:+ start:2502 stop:2750 length:249 start_codon:yes stop_codon:yes gene_type:complete
MNLGTIAFSRGDYGASTAAFRSVLVSEPDHHGALFNLGVALSQMGDLEGAQEVLARVVELDTCGEDGQEVKQMLERFAGKNQ